MPIRFQVDADFYDHPKTIGISDAACALWVKAGSFSAAKTTDGFIADDVLAHTLRYDRTAAEELVRRGLWKRVRGGFRYHQWADRNLTRERIEGDRKADRERKKAQRAGDEAPTKGNRASKNNMPSDARTGEENGTHEGGSNGTEQVNPQNVRPESERNPPGIQAESEGIPGASVSVSVSVSESVSGSGRDAVHGPPPIGAPPPPKCPTHTDDPNPPPCGPCADARRAHEAWEQDQAKAAALQRQAEARAHAELVAAEIANCRLCDSSGYRQGRRCTHDPHASQRTTTGAAKARAVIPQSRYRERADPDTALNQLDTALAEMHPAEQEEPQ